MGTGRWVDVMVVFWVKETRSSFEKGRGAGDLRTEGSFGIAAYKFKIETTNMFVCLSPWPRNSGEFDLTGNAIYHSVSWSKKGKGVKGIRKW